MEKTDFKANGHATVDHDPMSRFRVPDPTTGQQRSIDEMTDEEIARHIQGAGAELPTATHDLLTAAQNLASLNALLMMLSYEQARRRVHLSVARP